jgi:prevent-host-death family protein
MAKIYSTYDAKARFSEILRDVRSGKRVLISYRGEPVAEIRPIEIDAGDSVQRRLEELERAGALVPAKEPPTPGSGYFAAVRRRAGALKRFLEEREQE